MDLCGLSDGWRAVIESAYQQPWFNHLTNFLTDERRQYTICPAVSEEFAALQLTPLNQVRVVILGQDPYHGAGQAHGLSFSVPHGQKIPPSLRNIFRELQSDLGIEPSSHGCLTHWARQGVLLLNTVLTVRADEPHSHRGQGWEELTTRLIARVNDRPHVAFLLWGSPAQEQARHIADRHLIVRSAHPSPLSAYRGFFGSRPFSRVNTYLESVGQEPIDWRLPSGQGEEIKVV